MQPVRLEKRWIAGLFFVAITTCSQPSLASRWPDVALPENARTQWVSRDMTYNGLRMRTYRFKLERPLGEVVDFYRRRQGQNMVENQLGNKTVLGYMQGRHFVTIELSSVAGKTEGQVGIMVIPQRKPAPAGKSFEKPGSTRVYEEIIYRDMPGNPTTLRMGNQMSPYQNQQFFRRNYLRKGYVEHSGSATCSSASHTCITHYQKGALHASITTIRNEDETMIMAVYKD